MLSHLITAGYSEIDAAFANEGWNIGRWQEHKGYMMVFDEGNIEAGFAAELDIGPSKEVESGLL